MKMAVTSLALALSAALLASCAQPNPSAPASSAQAAAYREGRMLQMKTNRCEKNPPATDGAAFHCLWLSIKNLSWTLLHCPNGCPALVRAKPVPKSHARPAPILPAHYYTYEKNGEYGYEQQLSQKQIDAGIASAPLIMVRYLGQRQGVYRAEILSGATTAILSCSSPCDYITQRDYYYNPYVGSQLINTEVIPAGSTVAAAIMHDAMNGRLIPYDQTPTAKAAAAKRAAYERKREQQEIREQQALAAQQKAWQKQQIAEQKARQEQIAAMQAGVKQRNEIEQMRDLREDVSAYPPLIQSEETRYLISVRNETANGLLSGPFAGYFRSRLSRLNGNIVQAESTLASDKRQLSSEAQRFLKEWCQAGAADPASKGDCKTAQGYLLYLRRSR